MGKIALGIRIVNADGSRVSYLTSFIRWWAESLTKAILFGLGFGPTIAAMIMMQGIDPTSAEYIEAAKTVMICMLISLVLTPLAGFGYWMAGVTKEKKALHDVICRTRVVRK